MDAQDSTADGPVEEAGRETHGTRTAWAGRIVFAVVLVLCLGLLYRTLREYDFAEVLTSLRSIPPSHLLAAVGWAAASYLCLTFNEFLALRYARHPLPYGTAALTSFLALSIGHNIGFAALSSGAIRYRVYSRKGVTAEEVGKVILFCGATIVLGMCALVSAGIFARPDLAQDLTGLSEGGALALGGALSVIVATYLLLCASIRGSLRVFGWSIGLPGARLALGQTIVGSVNFAFVAACLHTVVSGVAEVSYFVVLCAFILANAAAIVTHAPGGLGIIETVVLLLLKKPELIGPVLAFRFVYYLLPLAIGGSTFTILEAGRSFDRVKAAESSS